MYTNILACIHASAPEIKSTEAFIYTNNTYENHVHKTEENMQFQIQVSQKDFQKVSIYSKNGLKYYYRNVLTKNIDTIAAVPFK